MLGLLFIDAEETKAICVPLIALLGTICMLSEVYVKAIMPNMDIIRYHLMLVLELTF